MAEALRPGGLYKRGETWVDASGAPVDAPTAEEKKAVEAKIARAWEAEKVLVEGAGREFRPPVGLMRAPEEINAVTGGKGKPMVRSEKDGE